MTPEHAPTPRYVTAARRTFLSRRAALVALVVIPGAACSNGDAAVFRSADAADTSAVDPTTTPTVVTEATESTVTTTAAVESTTSSTVSGSTTSTAPADATALFPESAELTVSFSFVPTSSRSENPYIAVWVEDLDGNLVQTISLWYESGKGERWLPELAQWYSASNRGSDVTMSGATRVAGDYTVVWDGTDLDGNPVAQGDYVLFVEAAREHGPHEITSGQIAIGPDGFTVELPADGELTAVSASLVA